jgi:hypothetical protein
LAPHDFGRLASCGAGGTLVFAPGPNTRVIIATNTFEVFDIEELAVELVLLALGET